MTNLQPSLLKPVKRSPAFFHSLSAYSAVLCLVLCGILLLPWNQFCHAASSADIFPPAEVTRPIAGLDSFDTKTRKRSAIHLRNAAEDLSAYLTGLITKTASQRTKSGALSVYQADAERFRLMVQAIQTLSLNTSDIHSTVRESSFDTLGVFAEEISRTFTNTASIQRHNPKSASIIRTLRTLQIRIYDQLFIGVNDSSYWVAQTAKDINASLPPFINTNLSGDTITPWKKEPAATNDAGQPKKSSPEESTEKSEDPFAAEDFNFYGEESTGTSSLYTLSGYIESESYIPHQRNAAAGAPTNGKSEIHLKTNFKVGGNTFYLKGVIHGYAYVPDDEITHPWYEPDVDIPELYLSFVQPTFDLQIGNQVIKWGKADTLNPTSYFNPYDLSENLLKDDDALFIGVPAIAGKYLMGDYALNAVITPFHTLPTLPDNDSPWALTFPDTQSMPTALSDNTQEFDTSVENAGYGLRFTGASSGMDFSFSAYHGPDRDVALVPVFNPAEQSIAMIPYSDIITAVGTDIAISLGNFTLQGEATYTLDKTAVTDPTKTGSFPAETETENFIYAAVGFTWITNSDYTFICEYLEGFYLNDSNRYLPPIMSRVVSVTMTKQFFNNNLTLDIRGLYSIENNDSILMPSLDWRFRDNLKLSVFTNIFSGDRDTLFGSYNDNDNSGLTLKYFF